MAQPDPAKPRARFVRLSGDDRRAALIEAALACIAQGGIADFTVDRVCARAHVSRGLITHHFGSMNSLLLAVYTQIYTRSLPPQSSITALLDHTFDPAQFNRDTLNIWLTLWSETSNNPDLRAEHRVLYAQYIAVVAAALTQTAPDLINAPDLARTLICLFDGLGLQHCIDPASMPATTARQICLDLIIPHIQPGYSSASASIAI